MGWTTSILVSPSQQLKEFRKGVDLGIKGGMLRYLLEQGVNYIIEYEFINGLNHF